MPRSPCTLGFPLSFLPGGCWSVVPLVLTCANFGKMNKGLLYWFLLLSFGCSAQKNLAGTYSRTGKDFKYTLRLNADSTFSLSQNFFEAAPHCDGKWQRLSKNTILLRCSGVKDVAELLSNGYMSEREKRIIVLSGNKLKLGQVILRKRKD